MSLVADSNSAHGRGIEDGTERERGREGGRKREKGMLA